MSQSDALATLALVVSIGVLVLEVRRWIEDGARLKLNLIADAIEVPKTDGRAKLALTVTNYGTMPTMITHMVAFSYGSIIQRLFGKPKQNFIINVLEPQPIPYRLEVADYWIGKANYNEVINSIRESNQLYVGVFCTHRKRPLLIKVPKQISSGLEDLKE